MIAEVHKPKFFREFRIGYWRYVHDCESAEGSWYWEGPNAKEISRSAQKKDGLMLVKAARRGSSLGRGEFKNEGDY